MKKKPVSSETILNSLADLHQVVGEGFERMDQRFSEMDQRFDRIEHVLLKDHLARKEKLSVQ